MSVLEGYNVLEGVFIKEAKVNGLLHDPGDSGSTIVGTIKGCAEQEGGRKVEESGGKWRESGAIL